MLHLLNVEDTCRLLGLSPLELEALTLLNSPPLTAIWFTATQPYFRADDVERLREIIKS